MTKKVERLQNGWVVFSKEMYEYYTDSEPPRNPLYVKQLLTDITSPATLLLFVLIILNFIQGMDGDKQSIIVCCFLVFIYVFMFLSITYGHRNNPVKIGLVKNIKRHPLLFWMSVAQVTTQDGIRCSVVFNHKLKNASNVEVLFLYAKKSRYSMVLAFREKNCDTPCYSE